MAGLAWGWFEAGWVRLRVVDLAVEGLPPELEGLRIAHLSDFHLGNGSRGERAVERAVDWVAARQPDVTAVTGDLLASVRAYPRLERLLARLPNAYAVRGNHDARNSLLQGRTRLLVGDSVTHQVRGRRVQIVGVDPFAYRRGHADPSSLADASADLRILLCHYPRVVDRLPPGAFDLVLAGHMHGGQIALPLPRGKVRFNPEPHLDARYSEGVYRAPAAVLHVSPGLGTTFVPFRFAARPEATELVLHSE